jgi:hypothetical protein
MMNVGLINEVCVLYTAGGTGGSTMNIQGPITLIIDSKKQIKENVEDLSEAGPSS